MSQPRPLARVLQARRRVDRAIADAEQARAELRQAIRDAQEAGYSQEQIGAALGVTRQRIAQILRGK